MNYEEFYDAVCETVEKFEASRATNKELDAYLLALLKLLEARGGEPFNVELMLEILSTAFESKRVEFNETWLKIERVPELAHFCKDGPAGGSNTFRSTEEPKTAADIMRCLPEGFEIKFDESRSANFKTAPSEAKFTNESRFFGIVSPSGHGWYNFDPFSLLECGARGLMDHAGEDAPVRGGWEMLGELLEMGRTYE